MRSNDLACKLFSLIYQSIYDIGSSLQQRVWIVQY